MARLERVLLPALAAQLLASPVCATSQRPDAIVVDGAELDLQTNPLEGYLAAHRDRRPGSNVISSDLWRGYVAHWTVDDGTLRLARVEVLDDREGHEREALRDVTAEYFPGSPLAADWYTGALIVPRGEMVQYVHMGYASEYEAYTVLIVRDGTVVQREDMTLTQFQAYKKRKFERFKTTAEYARELKQATKQLGSRASAEEFLREFHAEQYLAAVD